MSQDPRFYMRPGSLIWQIASLNPNETLLLQVGSEGVQTRQSTNSAAITKLRKFPGCERREYTQRVFYGVAVDPDEMIKLVRITRLPDASVAILKSTNG